MASRPDWRSCRPAQSSGWPICSIAQTRVRLEAAKAILDRHLGRPAIQADISLSGADSHIGALIETASKTAVAVSFVTTFWPMQVSIAMAITNCAPTIFS